MSSTDFYHEGHHNTFPAMSGDESSWQQSGPHCDDEFVPVQPTSLEDASLEENDVFRLILKLLYIRGSRTGRQIAEQIKLPFAVLEPLFLSLRNQLLIAYRGSSMGGDYEYELTPKGLEQAREHMSHCTFCGSAPVSLEDYVKSVSRQSLCTLSPKYKHVKHALSDLLVERMLISQVGQALYSGSSLFLHGAPGNGKTSIARRLIRAVSSTVWVPRTLVVGGEIIRYFDASVHDEVPLPPSEGLLDEQEIDHRWVRIQRPTITVGGELTLQDLEATLNPLTGIIEAPIHVKSNCGCLVVDDFGRQRVSPIELLNRWIVPLETKQDYLSLPTGRQVQVPFDQLLVFATNLTPEDVVDEAFLRRIPYKVKVNDPSEEQFRNLFRQVATSMNIDVEDKTIDHLLETCYRSKNRSMRFSHVQGLLRQVRDFCEFHDRPPTLNERTIEMAIHNFFADL